ncbi:uncharacterized protein DSM5745_00229 [Aspergillus mulundensis]|uniref:AMP-dependent synthetase/ligase domain-containing protein n=1 Tax=Aspergillus mulundensis TaxID=1810919 RepID=A0A3D8T2X4_9EURO|nr:hypothetical protein DSM5745_00229 [Aspergillus mulundensis]RDW92907.1 hypothetical protein DSM5745_00229 [Aspergillus mulundensis]
MKEAYEENLAGLPGDEREAYVSGFKNLERIRCSGAFLAPQLWRFWWALAGLPLKNAYGSTECGGGVTEVDVSRKSNVINSVGRLVTDPAIELKLSEETRGEFLVKSPWMLIEYIGNKDATRASFTDDGFLKTGDIGHLDGDEYVFDGRKNDDFIERVPRLAVEAAIFSLPYIAEAHVLRVPDHETRAVAAALIRIKPGPSSPSASEMTIARLHADLSPVLPAYMRPYLLRVLESTEEIPYTASQKPVKSEMLKRFFGVPVDGFWDDEEPTTGVQVWPQRFSLVGPPPDTAYRTSEASSWQGQRPWEWGTWQAAGEDIP